MLKHVSEFAAKGLSPPRGKNGFARFFSYKSCVIFKFLPLHFSKNWDLWNDIECKTKSITSAVLVVFKTCLFRASSMSPNARMARIASLENMLSISSNSLVAMASQLSEAEERERAFTNRGRWNQLRSMGEAKNLLQYMFNSVGDARCSFSPNLFFIGIS